MSFIQSYTALAGEQRLLFLYLFYLLISSAFLGSHAKALNEEPRILEPENCTINAQEGKSYTSLNITCVARSRWAEFNLVYWLANNNFIESEFPDGRVTEEPEVQREDQAFCIVEKSLVFSHTKPVDFQTNFTCIIQDPSGVHVKNITLNKEGPSNGRV
ncbi:interleukin-18-binding protein [Pelodytes ibericus]